MGDLSGNPPQENLYKLAVELTKRNEGICIIVGVEALFIKRTDGRWDEYHAVYFGDGGWTDNGFGKYIGCHKTDDVATCGEPTPPPANEIHVKRFGGRPGYPKFESVGRVKGYEYCTSVGFTNRTQCPVRPEPCEGCPWQDRVACEKLIFGTPTWKSDGEIHETENKNPWMRHITDGSWVQVCTGPEIEVEVCSNKLSY